MSLSDRQWNQIRAALAFWRAVAESSRVHPITHPAVQEYFGDDEPTPLTDDEIEVLIMRSSYPTHPFATVEQAAVSLNMSVGKIRAQLKRTGKEPMFTISRIRFYDPCVMLTAVQEITKRDEAFRRKYRVGQ